MFWIFSVKMEEYRVQHFFIIQCLLLVEQREKFHYPQGC